MEIFYRRGRKSRLGGPAKGATWHLGGPLEIHNQHHETPKVGLIKEGPPLRGAINESSGAPRWGGR